VKRCGPREGELVAEEEYMVWLSLCMLVDAVVGGACVRLCSGLAERRLSEPDREKEAMAGTCGSGPSVSWCPRVEVSSSLSSCILSIAPPVANPGLLGGGGGA